VKKKSILEKRRQVGDDGTVVGAIQGGQEEKNDSGVPGFLQRANITPKGQEGGR